MARTPNVTRDQIPEALRAAFDTATRDINTQIADWTIRLENQKCRAVEALRAMNFNVIAIGDSYNDTSMLAAANTGILLNPPQNVTDEFPQHPVATDHTELRAAIEQAASAIGE